MEAIFEILGELITTACITKKGIWVFLSVVVILGILTYAYFNK